MSNQPAPEAEQAPPATEESPEQAPPSTEPETPEEAPEEAPEGKEGAEAARYRRRLRETETELTTARTRLETFQRREVERLASDRLAVPGDLFAVHGVALDEVLGEDGSVDPDLVAMAVEQLVATRPGLARVAPQRTGPSAVGLGAREGIGAGTATWADVLRKGK